MNLKVSDAKREEGFTLIELLVVVIIIGILAAIAIPVFLNQRAQAWERTAQSDVRNAAIALESFINDNFTYPDATETTGMNTDLNAGDATTIGGETITPSPQVTLELIFNADRDQYAFCATHANLEGADDVIARYESAGGGLQETPNRSAPDASCVAL